MYSIALNNVPTLGALVGTSGSDSLVSQINQELGNSQFFGSIADIMSAGRQSFITNIVEPIRAVGSTIKNMLGTLCMEDKIISITNEDLLRSIPSAMHLPILQYAPIRKLFDEGRIFGFGHSVIPDGDPYGRLISNGSVEDVKEAMDKDGNVELVWEFVSTDPVLTDDELDSIEETRHYFDSILNDTQGDPTDWDNNRG